jgi:UDP-glucose 4-epimerase
MKRAVVTGGAGFIGSHLAEELVRRGYRAIVVDDLSSGKLANIEPFRDEIEFVHASVTDGTALLKAFDGADYVFHLAAIASVPRSIEDPATSLEVSVSGTLNVLLAAIKNGVKKVVLASSSAVYGDSPGLPKREDMAPCPVSPYALGKLTAENYCSVLGGVYHLPTACLRYFNVYGPRQDPGSQYAAVIPRFITGVLTGSPPVIFGDGEQTRDFVFVADVVAANLLVAESDLCGTFNISGGAAITMNQLAGEVMKLAGRRLTPVHQEARPGDIRHSLADISRAREFGFEPRYSLGSGLAETLKWYVRRSGRDAG